MYLAKHVGGWSTTRIGRFYSGRDHSTVCYALKRIDALSEADPEVDALLSSLAHEIRSAPPPNDPSARSNVATRPPFRRATPIKYRSVTCFPVLADRTSCSK